MWNTQSYASTPTPSTVAIDNLGENLFADGKVYTNSIYQPIIGIAVSEDPTTAETMLRLQHLQSQEVMVIRLHRALL